jgi:hypothetical protein
MVYQILGELGTQNLLMTLSNDELVKRTTKSFSPQEDVLQEILY